VVTAKAALGGLTRALAHELAQFGITVNCISPGMIATAALILVFDFLESPGKANAHLCSTERKWPRKSESNRWPSRYFSPRFCIETRASSR
jgi:NAD(P)-dependent dehydrogenase (short-subunit alcohol dehydrogenase family)